MANDIYSITGPNSGPASKTNDYPEKPKGKLSTIALVFLIIAAAAPLTVVAGGVPTNFVVSGLMGVPIGYLALGVVLLLFSVGYGKMSSSVRNTGAFFAYVAEGLGNRNGMAAAILALVSYNLMQIGLYGVFGFGLSSTLDSWFSINLPWWAAALLGWIAVAFLGVKNIDLSAKILGILVSLEFAVVLAVVLLALFNPPEGITTETIQPGQFLAPGAGVLLAFAIAAFMGFESAGIYSEESANPEKSVPRATYIAVTVISVFYAVSTWAFAQGIGPSNVFKAAEEHGPDLMFVWLNNFSVLGADIASFLFVLSSFAALLAFHNAAARYFFALGRAGFFPKALGNTGANGAPRIGSLVQTTLALVVLVIFALAGIDSELGDLFPILTLFTWLNMGAAIGLVFLLTITSVSVLTWINREQANYSIWVKWIAPVLSTIGLFAIFYLVLSNFGLMIGDTGPKQLEWLIPTLVISSGVIGFAYAELLRRQNPEAYQQLGKISYT